jgi:hypothetical protein
MNPTPLRGALTRDARWARVSPSTESAANSSIQKSRVLPRHSGGSSRTLASGEFAVE